MGLRLGTGSRVREPGTAAAWLRVRISGYAPPSTEGNAIAALILAIASFLVCPIITAIIALVLAGSAKRNILASGGTKQGLGIVTGARIIAWANIVVVTLVIIVVIIGVVAVGHSSTGDDRPSN